MYYVFFHSFKDGPANCSNVSVLCTVFPSAVDATKAELMIQLLANNTFMCAEDFMIHFNGETENVPVTSPFKNFTINLKEDRHFLEGRVWTVDFENRTGQQPCFFSIPG